MKGLIFLSLENTGISENKDCEDNLTSSPPNKSSTDVDGTKVKTIMGLISECVKSPPGVHPLFSQTIKDGSFKTQLRVEEFSAEQCTLLHRKVDA